MDFDERLMGAPRRPGRLLLKLAGLGLLAVLLGGFWLWSYAEAPGPMAPDPAAPPDSVGSGPNGGATEILVYIPPRSSLAVIRQELLAAGLLREDLRFRLLARLSGRGRLLKAGEYAFRSGATPWQILSTLAGGRTVRRQVTIPEGANLHQIAGLLAAEKLVAQEQFTALAGDPGLRARLGISSPSATHLEGYLFPDTYFFSRGQEPQEIIRVMTERGRLVLDELLTAAPGAPGLNRHQILTLASIVEKETAVPEERPLIARVFLNRLAKGMRLQTDPTVLYGLGRFEGGRLTRADLAAPTPYNTYLVRGLPPGPIASPGRAALAAVLAPAAADYLYFVAKNDGTHQFSTNLRDHNRAVNQYQRRP